MMTLHLGARREFSRSIRYIKSNPNILFTIERIVEAIEGIWKALMGFQPYFSFDVSFEGDLARKKQYTPNGIFKAQETEDDMLLNRSFR